MPEGAALRLLLAGVAALSAWNAWVAGAALMGALASPGDEFRGYLLVGFGLAGLLCVAGALGLAARALGGRAGAPAMAAALAAGAGAAMLHGVASLLTAAAVIGAVAIVLLGRARRLATQH